MTQAERDTIKAHVRQMLERIKERKLETGMTQWRVGNHYSIHVYEGERPVATFHTTMDARRAVDAVNRSADEIERLQSITNEYDRQNAEAAMKIELLRATLIRARGFVQNGIALGYIRMPDPDTPDTAHELPGLIATALAKTV